MDPSGSRLAPASRASLGSRRPRSFTTTLRWPRSASTRNAWRRVMLASTTAGLSLAGASPWPATPRVAARSETGRIVSRTLMTTWPSTWSSDQPAASALTTECMGTPKRRPAASTSRQGRTARVMGTLSRNSLPVPGSESTSTRPRTEARLARTTSRPTPRPDTSDTVAAVDRPERKMA